MSGERINWWQGVHLCRRSGRRGVRPGSLFRGHLLEAIHVALLRPDDEKPRLFIRFETDERKLSWASIARLAARQDFPTMI